MTRSWQFIAKWELCMKGAGQKYSLKEHPSYDYTVCQSCHIYQYTDAKAPKSKATFARKPKNFRPMANMSFDIKHMCNITPMKQFLHENRGKTQLDNPHNLFTSLQHHNCCVRLALVGQSIHEWCWNNFH